MLLVLRGDGIVDPWASWLSDPGDVADPHALQ
jgi:hypothetical protein